MAVITIIFSGILTHTCLFQADICVLISERLNVENTITNKRSQAERGMEMKAHVLNGDGALLQWCQINRVSSAVMLLSLYQYGVVSFCTSSRLESYYYFVLCCGKQTHSCSNLDPADQHRVRVDVWADPTFDWEMIKGLQYNAGSQWKPLR